MTSASALTLRSAGELAAAVPHLTGFVPEQSLVAISLRGKRRRVGLTLRADLDDSPALVRLVVDAMCRDGAGACVLSVHTSQRAPSGLPRSDLVRRLRDSLQDRGVPVLEALLVHGGRYWSYLDAGESGPEAGTAVPTSGAALDRLAAGQAFAGRAVLPSREALVAGLQPRPALGPAVALRRQEAAVRALLVGLSAAPELTASLLVQAWSAAVAGWRERPGTLPADVPGLVVGLAVGPVRDAVATWLPDRDGGEALLGLLSALAREAVPPHDAPVCAVLAWAGYVCGDGAFACVAAQRALASEPDCSFALLLLEMLDRQVPPATVAALLRRAGVGGAA